MTLTQFSILLFGNEGNVYPHRVAGAGIERRHNVTDKFQGQHLVILDGIEVVGQTPDHDNGPYNRTETLQSVTMPDTVKSIEWKTFEHCANLKEVRLSANLESIGLSAFRGCSNLRTVTFPKSLKKIEIWAFASTALTNIYYDGTIEEFDRIEFGGGWCQPNKPVVHCSNGVIDFGSEPFFIEELRFTGTKAEWVIQFGTHPWFNRRIRRICCSDGTFYRNCNAENGLLMSSRKHRRGPSANTCTWCGSTADATLCIHSPTGKHEK